jgi:quinolinate synthase
MTGDSLAMARDVSKSPRKGPIVVCGVYFMAETVKILNPDRVVLSPDPSAGCSLADSITPEDVLRLRQKHPGVPVVVYVNTSAEVKAVADACCTSSNAVKVVESFDEPEILMLPDQHLANFVAARTSKKIRTWNGACEVHELFSPKDVSEIRQMYPGTHVLVHPECDVSVQQAADFVGSTAQLADYIAEHQPENVSLLTECTMSDNLKEKFPSISFVQPCSLCPHMRKINLESILKSLKHNLHVVEVDPQIIEAARKSLDRMLRA